MVSPGRARFVFGFGLLLAGLLAAPRAVRGQPAAPNGWSQAESPSAAMEQARAAIARGDLLTGDWLLARIDVRKVDPNDYDFLSGTLAFQRGDYREAIRRFKAILRRNPSLNRVRLELARACFMAGDYTAAKYYFQAAIAQGLPAEAESKVEGFLDVIRRKERWDVTFNAAVAPDTNVNAATTAESVNLYGLPFELSQNTRQESGVGATFSINGSYQWPISSDTHLKVGESYYDAEYGNSAFDDRNLYAYVGPRFLLPNDAEISVFATGSKRWYGNKPFTYGAGPRIEGQVVLSPHWLLGGFLAEQNLRYENPDFTAYSGPVYSGGLTPVYAFNAISYLRFVTGVTREETSISPLRDSQYTVGVGYYRERLPYGFTVFAAVQPTAVLYDSALAAFGVTRRDWVMDYRVSFSNKRIDFHGFTPVITLIHTDRYSNISLYSFSRNRGEFGLVRNF